MIIANVIYLIMKQNLFEFWTLEFFFERWRYVVLL